MFYLQPITKDEIGKYIKQTKNTIGKSSITLEARLLELLHVDSKISYLDNKFYSNKW